MTVRRVADMVDASTQMIYTNFGSKAGLIDALYAEAHTALTAAIRQAARGADPIERLHRAVRAYRRFGIGNPTLFHVMFGGALGEFERSAGSLAAGRASFATLLAEVERAQRAGALEVGDAESAATQIWCLAHGITALEISGQLMAPAKGRSLLLDAALSSLLAGMGSMRGASARS